ncbi:uncharacterized protein PITG_07958 [Phytophthora infestans T30-4]|uniref:RWP-RK domain-containing protein n=2 Tax=Phytophthora infestans TaxID=4787 RepID=D0N954_PHYIT|nr:uncharacterized protein PITG_07958 [Phytophthora infestans T30-4]EEY54342.1 conserved hypothetical protein [Phytophthora infestans T30-4]KAF4043649.1 RWP-RK domain [Phytophthora infestans]KAF4146793.1 RWP-RK domain [Phytophthora infestans]KAI9983083.1 hypothetical protein PInf_007006 [Phytophthora infestans]|eukprot:XP_002904164.1 conserved hypothetical protein [Phytophthora infestans T30-4]
MLQHSESLAPLNLQLVSSLEDVYMQSPVMSDGHAARAHAARKSAFLSMSPTCNFEAFSLHFHLPLKVAAEKFGVRATAFKKRCRAIGIRHWPYRKVRSLKRSLQELNRCQEQAPLSDKQQAQYATFKCQLDRLMAPETYGLDPSGRLGPQHQQLLACDDDDEDAESENDNDSLASQSPRFGTELGFYDCTVSPTDGNAKTLGDVIPAGSAHLRIRRSQVMHLPPAHLSFFDRGLKTEQDFNENYYAQQQFYGHFDSLAKSSSDKAADLIMKASPASHKKAFVEDYPPSAFDSADLDFLPSETKYADVRSLNDADEEFTAHASQVDYSSERFFDDVFLQISPDYGCLV